MDIETKALLEKTRVELLAIVITGEGVTKGFTYKTVETLLGRSYWDEFVRRVFTVGSPMSKSERAQLVLDALNRVHPPE